MKFLSKYNVLLEKLCNFQPVAGFNDRIQILRILVLAAVYFGASRFGFSLALVAEQVTVIWPPTGIALAATLLLGYRVWPGIMLGAFLANVTLNEPVVTALSIATGNTLEALTAAWLLNRYIGEDHYLDRVKGVLGLVLFSTIISTMVSATIGTTSLCLSGLQSWANFDTLWLTWWIGDAGGSLIVAPLLLAWCRGPYPQRSLRNMLEALIVLAATLAVSITIFMKPLLTGEPWAYMYMVFPIVIWTVMRFGQQGVTLITLLISGIAVWATSHNLGPFAVMPAGEALTMLQVFTMTVAWTGLMMGAAMSERLALEKTENQSKGHLNTVIENIVDGLITINERGIVQNVRRQIILDTERKKIRWYSGSLGFMLSRPSFEVQLFS